MKQLSLSLTVVVQICVADDTSARMVSQIFDLFYFFETRDQVLAALA